ncbi:hypothetical protein Ancab_012570 [Ancistrocladus abbreviatus]
MAIDGSFCLHAELDRFLARCPNLRCINTFTSLLEKGTMLAEDKLVDSVAALFLHSTYTIPVIGCFRPVAGKILDKVVESLRLVSNLGSNIGGAVEDSHGNQTHLDFEDVDGVEASNIIDFYSKTGRGLDLHERACFAFCRALDLVPSLKGHVECYYDFAPPPFIRIPELMPKFKCSAKNSEDCSLDDDDTKLGKNVSGISWSGSDAVSDIIWCAGQILSVVLKLPNKTIASSGLNEEDGLACLLRWHEFCCDSSLEKAGWHSVEANKLESSDGDTCFHEEDDTNILSSKLLKIEPLKRGRRVEKRDISGDCSPFVITSAVKKSYERVVLAVHQKWPVLLCGPGGSGKTALVKKLALDSGNRGAANIVLVLCTSVLTMVKRNWSAFGNKVAIIGLRGVVDVFIVVDEDIKEEMEGSHMGSRGYTISLWELVLFIHMDEQIDGRMLIGSYVCTEQPGEFRWQPGSLTQAAMNGLWVVFENIDQALSDVQSILLPLLEGGRSIVTGHGETIKVAEGFRLFSTISSCKPDVSPSIEGRNSLSALWRRVMVRSPSSRDLIDVVTAWYPDLEPIAEKVSATFESVNQLSRSCSGISGVPNTVNRFSTRDLLRWCKRFSGSGFTFKRDDLTASMRTIIFLEAVDIFSASSGSLGNRHTIVESIAKMWDVSVPLVDTLRRLDKPIFRDSPTELQIGRITLQCPQVSHRHQNKPFVAIRSSLHALERIACSVKWNEPVLLVGETGTGKTTLIQSLATRLGHRLTVLNLSQQSDVADLLGGFKPVDPQSICIPLFKEFEDLFSRTFPSEENKPFLASLAEQFRKKNWEKVLRRFGKGVEMVVRIKRHGSGLKRKRPVAKEVLNAWKKFALKVEIVHRQVAASSGMLFSFVEGAFVTSLRNGDWILLDEVNLAPPETLQRIVGVLDGENGSLCLAERGDIEYLYRHPNFRIFACMNPATDAGKRDLPYSLRSRFTEYFIDDVLDDDDLTLFVSQFIDDSHVEQDLVNKIVHFYKAVKKEAEERLQDGANQKPQYSLRSLYRALEYAREARRRFEFQDALYDGFCLLFMTSLDKPSSKIMNGMIVSKLLGKPPCDIPFEEYLAKVLKPPKGRSQDAPISRQKIQIHMKLEDVGNYVLTESVRKHLKNLARAMLIRRYPVLLQGPTSGGKTSLVKYLAAITGHEFVRINNHEHTDLQEYLGSYITDVSGKLVFQEGALVKAIRNGHWIVLDELNLAPSDVLEALNRLLDDNRELFVPELSETICAHPDFMLFATQNPPIIYGGRKMLSRAFRNRFIEIHVDEIPEDELSTILMNRCKIAGSYAKKMVKVMRELQLLRQSSKMFAGKHGFITPRDLFRWADRFMTDGRSYDDLARDGYLLLAERLRDENEKSVVQEVLERHLHVRILKDELYKQGLSGMADESLSSANSENIVWTGSMWRLYFLVERCYRMREPVLLVGETGGGKTTVCQLLSSILQSKLHILNCHQYTETSDFIGGFYPVRERSRIMLEFTNLIEQILSSKAFTHFPMDGTISSDINQASSTLHKLGEISNSYKGVGTHSPLSNQDLVSFEQMRQHLSQLHQKWQTIFTWQDGPLVQAMKNGDLFLVDEISLADDSVLERLNSILEPERKLSLAEKGGSDLEKITAHRNFFLLATMNPGGDYGKKELSPALRNRFTEIWVPPVSDLDELRSIAVKRFSSSELHALVDPMLSFWERAHTATTIGGVGGAFGRLGPHKEVAAVQDHALFNPYFNQNGEDSLCTETASNLFFGGPITVRIWLANWDLRAVVFNDSTLQLNQVDVEEESFDHVQVKPNITSALMERDQMRETITGPQKLCGNEDLLIHSQEKTEAILFGIQEAVKQASAHSIMENDLLDVLNSNSRLSKWAAAITWQELSVCSFVAFPASTDDCKSLFYVVQSFLESHNTIPFSSSLLCLRQNSDTLFKVNGYEENDSHRDFTPRSLEKLDWVNSGINGCQADMYGECGSETGSLCDVLWFNQLQTGRVLTVRDLLSWVAFINTTKGSLQPDYAFLHGAFLVLLDGISLGTSISKNEAAELRRKCLDFLLLQLKGCTFTFLNPEISCIENYGWGNLSMTEDISWRSDMQLDNSFGIHPFYIKKGHDKCEVGEFEFLAPTTHRNVLRVLRAVQVAKPVLLEGSPGVGKTSLIVALGKFSGHKVVRINLSEQTDMMDLLGSDLPVESEEGMQFAWSDGILLQALKEGSWILLDELNLAPQSGLNAILDHRAEVFIPELGLSFKCPPSFRVFACQNPSYQGGGRKGLPKSFLNRFTKVYVDELAEDDYQFICRSLFPSIPRSTLTKLIQFNKRLYEETMLHRRFAQNGAPWEFNLRDVIRSCQIIQGSPDKSECHSFLNVVYVQRMRTDADRREVLELYQHIFGVKPSINPYPRVQLNGKFLVVGNACIKRNNFQSTETLCTELKILPDIRNSLEAAVQCVQQQWLCILIGQTSCGKTSLVRLLAQLTGNVLNEINLSSSTDTSDLIGCFEQFNAFRNFQSVVAQVDRYVKEYCSQNLEPSLDRLLRERKGLIAQWLSSSSKLNFDHVSRSCSTDDEKWSSSLSVLVEIIEYLRRDMDRNMSPISWSHDDLDKILQRIRKLQEVQYGRPSSAKFGWVAGLLIKAMEHGEWVLLEDANLCNPTVLDRINSLAESNGSITVNECGNVDGKPLILHPHPDFRMFLTVNPSYGEVSRAMRNRGVEIAMMKPYWLFEKEGGYRSKKIELNDVKRFLVLSNIPRGLLIDSMAKAHLYARDEGLRLNVDITYRELARWIQLFQQLLTSGNHLLWSLQRSWEHTYISSFGEYEGWDIVNHAKISYLSVKPSSSLEWSLCLPGGWPLPLKLRDFVWYSNETFVRQNCMYLESLGSQYASFERSLSQNQDLSLCLSAESLKAIYLMDSRMLQQIINPKYVNACSSSGSGGLDLALAGKMLLFSADWTVEQATENDLKLYLLWFSWFNSQLQPYCEVFGSYLALFRKELQHPIWECIFHSRRELMSHQGLDHCLQSLPILALESVDLVESKGKSVSSVKLLHNAINCVGLLRRSLWQWNAERMHAFTDQSQQFKPLLKSLRILEEEVLKMIVKSPSFDFLFRTYNDLLEEHISWWNSIVASQLDHQLVHLSCLIKNVMKLQDYCPQEVKFVAVSLVHNPPVASTVSIRALSTASAASVCAFTLY